MRCENDVQYRSNGRDRNPQVGRRIIESGVKYISTLLFNVYIFVNYIHTIRRFDDKLTDLKPHTPNIFYLFT